MTSAADEIVFQSEGTMWQMLRAEGVTGIPAKPFDMRQWDLSDDRIYRLSWKIWKGQERGEPDDRFQQKPPLTRARRYRGDCPKPHWPHEYRPEVDRVTFVNKATGEGLTRAYLGMEFTAWAPGWCFLMLGDRISSGHVDDG